MQRDDLDRFLTDDEIVPSSGFVARIMGAVHAEAAVPPAIPFPWTRALPGIVATGAAFVALIAGFVSLAIEGPARPRRPPAARATPLSPGSWLCCCCAPCRSQCRSGSPGHW